MVHTPEGFPDVSIGYKMHAIHNRISRISVSVEQVKADDSLSRHAQRDLQCFAYNDQWKNEAPYYRSHDEDTCYTKCRLRTIYEMCNCTQYFFKLYKGKPVPLDGTYFNTRLMRFSRRYFFEKLCVQLRKKKQKKTTLHY